MCDIKNYLSDNSGNAGEQRAHIKYASQAKDIIVEIGVLFGDTTKILLNNSNCLVYGIDPIIPDSMDEKLIGSVEKINELKVNSRFIFIQDYSYNVIKDWKQLIDYIFIDGDHKYNAVKKDFNDWFPFIKQNGIIAFHDSALYRGGPRWWEGPSQLADELLKDNRLEYLETISAMTIFKKL
jgi:predicted O-methyltransferase YrrM